LNLDELAVQQEEEEKRRALEEEEEEEEQDEEDEVEVEVEVEVETEITNPIEQCPINPKENNILSGPTVDIEEKNESSIVDDDQLEDTQTQKDIDTTENETAPVTPQLDPIIPSMEPALTSVPPEKFPVSELTKTVVKTITKIKEKREKKPKKKKKKRKKHLNFFGIRGDEEEEEEEEDKKEAAPAAPGDFDISCLWDHDAIVVSDDEPTINIVNTDYVANIPTTSSTQTAGEESSSEKIRDEDSSSLPQPPTVQSPSNTVENNTAKSIIVRVPQTRSFFDNVDAEVDLENDPFLRKVEENKRQLSLGQSQQAVDYLSYFQQLAAPYLSANKSSNSSSNTPYVNTSSNSSSSSTSNNRYIRITGIGSNSLEERSLSRICSQSLDQLRLTWTQTVDKCGSLGQQMSSVYIASQWTVGSVLLTTASMSYLIIQLLLVVVQCVLRITWTLVMSILDVILLGVGKVLGDDQWVLPCTVQSCNNNRQV
jgi:hypothetical protein